VDGEAITADEVETALRGPLARLQEQIHLMKRQTIESLIAERLLAKEAARRGISVQALLDAEVTGKTGLVTEREIDTVYQANKAQLSGEEASLREQIRARLQNQRLAARREALLRSLLSRATVVVRLKAPPVFRADVAASGAPFKGPATAPVTIVKFEDFHCPFCKRVQPVLTDILSRSGQKVKLVHRDFPIDGLHPQARKAHEAARCANDQARFWAYHDVLYANAPQASPDQLKAYAQEVGLDLATFEQCVDGGKYRAAVQQDVVDGTRAGVTGTPAFFINGRLVSGVQSVDGFVRVIEDELARAK
jgi:protein-disulfide isomerase